MTKTKKVLIILSIVVVLIIAIPIICVVLYVKINDYRDYLANKKCVYEYVADKYSNIDYQLIKKEMGKNAFPASRQSDSFIYYDVTNDLYFKIRYSYGMGLQDDYGDALGGRKITSHINSAFSPDKNLNYMMRCWKRNGSAYCQIIYFTDQTDIDFKIPYDMYVFLAENYPQIEIDMMISLEQNRNQYEVLFSYKKIKSLSKLPNLYYRDIRTNKYKLNNLDEFKQFLSEGRKTY